MEKINTTVALQSTIDKLFDSPSGQTAPPARDTVAIYMNSLQQQGYQLGEDSTYQQQKQQQKHQFKMNLELKKDEYKIDIDAMIDDFQAIQATNNQVLFDDLEE